jgi:[protein-PII] uridylyltransferase
MPRSYRGTFEERDILTHAAIVQRRGASVSRAEVWKELAEGMVAICVVADDGPGLLARASAALVAHDFDVVAAQAYCRTRGGAPVEAIDFFWVRRVATAAPLASCRPEVARFAETLDALLRGTASVEPPRAIRPSAAEAGSARVRFDTDARDGALVLTVHAHDRPGLLFAITDALFRESVRIARSDVTTHEGVVFDRFHLTELDGTPLRRARLLGLQTAVLAAIEGARPGPR